MRFGLLGGSFDPIHNGHLKLAKAAQKQLRLHRIYFILSPRSPFKIDQKPAPLKQRSIMVKKAIKNNCLFRFGAWELNKAGPVRTVDTIKKIKKQYSKASLFFIMGSDAWRDFPKWKKPREILKHAKVVVGRRPGSKSIGYFHFNRDQVVILKGVFPNISSTQIRETRKKRKLLNRLVPDQVAQYIIRQSVY